jgi:Bacterial Ig domain
VETALIEVKDAVSGKSTKGKLFMKINGTGAATPVPFFDAEVEMGYDSSGVPQPVDVQGGFSSAVGNVSVGGSLKHGTVSVVNGKVVYTPNSTWDGTETFTLEAVAAPNNNIVTKPITVHVYDRAILSGRVTLEECGCGGDLSGEMRSNGGALVEYADAAPSLALRYNGGSLYAPVVSGSGYHLQ